MKKRIFSMLSCVIMVCFLMPISAFAANLYVALQDIEEPVFEGIKNDEIYCQSVKFKVTDNDGVASVKTGETLLTADEDGYYTLTCGNDLVVEYTVTATDTDGNEAAVSLTIIRDHRMSEWDSDGEYIWRICTFCGSPSDVKYEKPEVQIVGDDTVCRSEQYQFTVKIPSNCEFSDCSGPIWPFMPQLQADGTYLCVIENDGDYHGRDSINMRMDVFYSTDEGEYLFHVDKAVTVVEHEGGTANCKDKAVCSKCGKPYGETDPENHKEEFKHYDAKSATVAEVGNIEYWYCAACDKYYSDKNGNTEITKAETVLAKITPEIIDGGDQKVTVGENKELTFRLNAAFADIIRVEVDGVALDAMFYTVKEGSTIVALKADYLATLLAGEHTLDIVSESGIATTSFTVNEKVVNDETSPLVEDNDASPITEDNSHMALWLALLFASGSLLAVTGIFGKKKIME